jgi:hypothetical protein
MGQIHFMIKCHTNIYNTLWFTTKYLPKFLRKNKQNTDLTESQQYSVQDACKKSYLFEIAFFTCLIIDMINKGFGFKITYLRPIKIMM